MLIEHIELRDWGPHAHLSMDTDSRVVGILGGNGKGKSNILNALSYALTGELGSAKGTDFIRGFGHDGGAQSCSVAVRFRKGSEHGSVSRTVNAKGASKRVLEWHGEKLTRAADVDASMLEILGCDKDAVKNAVYIRQGEVDKLVKGTPSERQDTFIKLLNLSMADKRADMVKKKAAQLRLQLHDHSDEEETVTVELGELELKMGELASEIGTLSSQGGTAKADGLRRLLTCLDKQAETHAAMSRAQAAFMERSHALKVFEASFDPGALERASGELAAASEKLTAANNALLAATERESHKRVLLEAEERVRQASDGAAASKDLAETLPSAREKVSKRAEVDKLVAEREAHVRLMLQAISDRTSEEARERRLAGEASEKAAHFVDVVKRHHVACLCVDSDGVCPVCGTHVGKDALEARAGDTATLEAMVSQARDASKAAADAHSESVQKIAKITAVISNLQEEISKRDTLVAGIGPVPEKSVVEAALAKAEEASTAYNCAMAARTAAERTVDNEMAWLDAHPSPEVDTLTAKQAADAAREAMDKAAAVHAGASAEAERHARLKELADEAAKVSDEAWKASSAASEAVSEAHGQFTELALDKASIEKELEDCVSRAGEIARLEGENKAVKDAFNRATERLADIMRAKERDKAVLELIGDLQAVAGITCRTGVPLAFADSVFRTITPLVQEMLERMQSNFRVHPDPDRPLTYLFTPEGKSFSLPQERLSGGQAVRLAVAMLLAAQRTVLPEVGLLVMDEPSSHVDTEGVEHMRDMFAKLASILDNADMQLIVVDHNPVLESAFGKTIRL